MVNKTFYLVSLGCSKNTVDSESMSVLLQQDGYTPVEKATKADILIVNTCGFIQPARQESFETLHNLARKKKKGQLLIAAGCLPERHRKELSEQIPGLDGIIGTRRWMDIVNFTQKLRQEDPTRHKMLYHIPDNTGTNTGESGVPRVAIQGGSAYLKIADGCRRPCAFCAIPLIKGTGVSRSPELIIQDASSLQDRHINELVLIAQDTTDYGHDLGIVDGLSFLLEKLSAEVDKIPWIRVLYAYPGYVTDKLIQIMAESRQILHYLDIPLQHAHPEILRQMRRPSNPDWIYKTLEKMRAAMPDLALRTTFIVGYPGETETEFQTLLDFISEIKFDHVGAFIYSFEPGTTSEPLGDPVPMEVKQERLERLMLAQEKISLERNQVFIGRALPVLVEGQNEEVSVGRTYRDAPEIDGLVIIEGKAPVGEITPIQITGAMTHDLIGRLVPPVP